MPEVPVPDPAPLATATRDVPLFATPGHYIRSRRKAAGMSIDDVALCVETDPPVAASRRAEWLDDIERDIMGVRPTTAVALYAIPRLAIDLNVLATLIEEADGDAMTIRFRAAATVGVA